MKKSGFPPVIDKNTEILILGTLPSDKSFQAQEYYANPKNQFWRIIFTLFNDGNPLYDYDDKIKLLLKNKIGLWDVLTKAKREGSLDKNIAEPELNDFSGLFKEYPKIRLLAFNGNPAFTYFMQMKAGLPETKLTIVSSSSSANTSKTLALKIKEWQVVFK